MFHVDSEVGLLRQVILHRPDLELKRLTPDNISDLLFDDMLWVSRAQAEHDAFAEVPALARGGGALLRRPARRGLPGHPGGARRPSLTGCSTRAGTGRWRPRPCGRRWTGSTRPSSPCYLAGGITKREIAEIGWRRRASPSTPSTRTGSCSRRCRTC